MKCTSLILNMVLLIFVAGCSNPVSRTISTIYSDADPLTQGCLEAERKNDMSKASEICYQAYVTADWDSLTTEQRSEQQYDLGRVLRKSGRYDVAIEALEKSIQLEMQLTGPSNVKYGRRAAELAAAYLENQRFNDGVIYMDSVIPLAPQFTPQEKQFVGALLYFYSQAMESVDRNKSGYYIEQMIGLGFATNPYN